MEDEERKLRLVASQPAPAAPSRIPFIKQLSAEILRNLMKAAATQSPDDGIARSLPAVKRLVEELQTTDEEFRYWDVLLAAVNTLRPQYRADGNEIDYALDSVARAGFLYFTELTATDNARNGRMASRRADLLRAIHYVEELESERRRAAQQAIRDANPKKSKKRKKTVQAKKRILL
jgi:hypothetical protein